MAISIVSKLTGNGDSEMKDAKKEADKYRLRVTAGPAYDLSTHKPVLVNTDTATYIENEFIRAKIKVRIRGYCGLPSTCPESSPYFDDPIHAKDQYSVAFSFVPKRDLPSVDTVWGNDFDHPVRDRLPPGFNTAVKIVKEFIDPGLSCDAYADEPWLYGPSLSCWFALRVGEKVGEEEDFAAPSEQDVMKEGADGEAAAGIRQKMGIPDNNEKRRKFFLDASNREKFVFEKGRVYQGDFYNPYLDFGKFALKLPGFSLGVIKYIDGKTHYLRYVFKNRETGELYFNVNMTLLFGEQLQEAMEKDTAETNKVAVKQAESHPGADEKTPDREATKSMPDVPKPTEEELKAQQAESERSKSVAEAPSQNDGVDEITDLLQDTASGDLRDRKPGMLL